MIKLSTEILKVINSRKDMEGSKDIATVIAQLESYIQLSEERLEGFKATLANGSLSQQIQWEINNLIKQMERQIADMNIMIDDYITIILEEVLVKSGILK